MKRGEIWNQASSSESMINDLIRFFNSSNYFDRVLEWLVKLTFLFSSLSLPDGGYTITKLFLTGKVLISAPAGPYSMIWDVFFRLVLLREPSLFACSIGPMLLYKSYFLNYRFYLHPASSSPTFFPLTSLLLSSLPLCESEKFDNSYLYRTDAWSWSAPLFWGVLWARTWGDLMVWTCPPWPSAIFPLSVSSTCMRALAYSLGVCMSMVPFLLGFSLSKFILGDSIIGSEWKVIFGDGITFVIDFSWDLLISSLSCFVFFLGILSGISSSS